MPKKNEAPTGRGQGQQDKESSTASNIHHPGMNDKTRVFEQARAAIGRGVVEHFTNAPGAEWRGSEFFTLNPIRGDSNIGSFSISELGLWHDFADDSSGDLIDLIVATGAKDKRAAAEAIIRASGGVVMDDEQRPSRGPGRPAKPVAQIPAPEEALKSLNPATKAQWVIERHGTPVKGWTYRTAAGGVAFCVTRHEKSDGSKNVLPWYFGKDSRWQMGQALETGRPLYKLDQLVKADRGTRFLIVEGEKCASVDVPGFLVTCWSGGAAATSKTDWAPLEQAAADGRVIIWPDADEPGRRAALAVANRLPGAKILQPTGKPAGWDIADAATEKLDLAAYIGANLPAHVDAGDIVRVAINLQEVPQLHVQSEILANALAAAKAANVFTMAGYPVRVLDVDGVMQPQALTVDSARHLASTYCCFIQMNRQRSGEVFPPREIVQDLLARGAWPWPTIDGVNNFPTIGKDGVVAVRNGYHASTRLFLDLPKCLADIDVPDSPSDVEVSEALERLDEAFCDFRFDAQASRDGVLALLLTILCRPAVQGPTPMFYASAAAPRTGKTKLVQALLQIVTGRMPGLMTLPRDDDELEKKMVAELIKAPPAFILDNLTNLNSPVLAAITTSDRYQGRILGKSETREIPARSVAIVTGNNVTFSHELARRVVPIRLVAETETPWLRTDFKHGNIHEWVIDQRPTLIRACLTLARAWFAAGSPAPRTIPPLGGFENWHRVVCGILEHAQRVDLFANAAEFFENSDTESDSWGEFVKAWRTTFDTRGATIGELKALAVAAGVIEEKPTVKGTETSLGSKLARMKDRVFAGYRITKARTSNGQTWRLRDTKKPDTAPTEDPNQLGIF
jgi:hypothetical protein